MKGQPSPVSLPKELHGQSSLVELQSKQLQRVGHDWAAKHTTYKRSSIFGHIWSCLKHPRKHSICAKRSLIFDYIFSCPKCSWRHLIHAKKSVIFLSWPRPLHINQICPWTFWIGSNFKDLLAWTKCLMDIWTGQMSCKATEGFRQSRGAPNLAKTCMACPLAFCSSGSKPSWLTVNPGMVFQHLRLTFLFLPSL